MSTPYYGPDEPIDTINLERNFLAGDVIVGVGYGIQLMMALSCVRYLWRHKQQRKSMYLIAYIGVLLIVETVFVAVQARTVQIVYVDNRNYPGGPWEYFLATQNLPVNVAFAATLFILTFLSDLLVLWRCWVIWTASGKLVAYVATFFPALTLAGSFAMGTLWTLGSSQPGLSFYSKVPMAYGTAYYAISLSVNIILTILITTRLLFYRKRVLTTLPPEHAKHYISLATIIVESATLYSIFALIFLITYAVGNPTNQVWFGIASATQQIANYLIIYRLADGSAWNRQTMSNAAVTTMAFQANAPQSSTIMANISTFHAASNNQTTSTGTTNPSIPSPNKEERSTTIDGRYSGDV